ncbi:MAG: Hin recombinase [Candidatus Competibacteraceae bacterium]|nr:Hin recombinase [Candidatus Competibacteraceae bacterium]MCB1810748.1 Hin recombinase [Candidatus Competibacteraceae bacterium]
MGGRPKKLSEADIEAAKALLSNPKNSVEQAAERLGVAPSTVYRHIPGVTVQSLYCILKNEIS